MLCYIMRIIFYHENNAKIVFFNHIGKLRKVGFLGNQICNSKILSSLTYLCDYLFLKYVKNLETIAPYK